MKLRRDDRLLTNGRTCAALRTRLPQTRTVAGVRGHVPTLISAFVLAQCNRECRHSKEPATHGYPHRHWHRAQNVYRHTYVRHAPALARRTHAVTRRSCANGGGVVNEKARTPALGVVRLTDPHTPRFLQFVNVVMRSGLGQLALFLDLCVT